MNSRDYPGGTGAIWLRWLAIFAPLSVLCRLMGLQIRLAVPVIPELWNDAIPKVPVPGDATVSEGGLSPGGAAVVSNMCEVVVSKR